MPKTPDEIIALAESWTFDLFLEGVGCTREMFMGFATNGIPEDWADVLAAQSNGRLPLSIWPKIIHRPRVLTRALDRVKTVDMDLSHRLAISEGRGGSHDQRFKEAMKKAGYTQEGLAEAANISPSMLSRARAKKRAIRVSKARRIQALIGWPADDRHWPGGIVED